jgi:hypothetical protein
MPTEINSTIEATDNSEKKGLTLRRIRVEAAKSDSDGRILGDYPSGLLVSD